MEKTSEPETISIQHSRVEFMLNCALGTNLSQASPELARTARHPSIAADNPLVWERSQDRLGCGVFSVSCEMTWKSRNYKKIRKLSTLVLDISTAGVTIKYHLRSISGSNGLRAKESSPLLGIGPI
jgi:hypothetical protein